MTTTIEAVYEGGLFRPTVQITLTEGTHVEVLIPKTTKPRDPKVVADRLAQVAEKSAGSDIPETTSQNHDKILYDRKIQP